MGEMPDNFDLFDEYEAEQERHQKHLTRQEIEWEMADAMADERWCEENE